MKLSIIVPVYKVEPYLRKCVDSILAQTFTDFELILVDDGSPDGCPAICDEYAQKDSRVKVIHKENGGLSDARNAGLDIAQGEYIGFVDSDDWIHPEMYRRLLNTAERTESDIVACQYSEVPMGESDENWELYGSEEYQQYERETFISGLYPNLYSEMKLNVWNKIYRRTIFHKLRFPRGRRFEDYYLQLPILCNAQRLAIISDVLYAYYRHPGSIMSEDYQIWWANDANAIFNNNFRILAELGEWEQYQYQLDQYLVDYFRNFFAIKYRYPQWKQEFMPIKREADARFFELMRCPKICKMSKIMLVLLYISPKLALQIGRRYMPHCVYGFMR